jgi:hypothetical protein
MVAFPLAPFLMRAGITALGAGAAGEGIKSLQNINPDVAEQAFLRTIIGPISDIFNRTTDTPSGKVFAPTGEVIEPNQIPGIAPPEQQQGITGLPIPEQQQGITGLPIPEKAPGLPGLINPEQVDTSILNKEENTSKSAGSLIDQNLFNENALAKQDDQAYQVNMTPDQYLSLTRKIESGDLENTKERTQRIKDAIKKGGKIENYPYLYIKKEGDNFLVTGEEGRHRALVLKELGVKQMPVMIRGIGSAKDGIENKRYTTPATGYAATDPYLKKFAGYKPKLIISDKTAEKPFQISWENLTEDQSVNLKGLVSRSVGQEKGMKAIREIYNDDNFLDILNPDQQKYINNLEYSYVGGVGDLGNPIIPHIFDNPMLEQNQEYMQDYQQKLANLLEKNLGKKFPVYRLMDKKTALAIVTGDLPDIKTLQEDPETGESVLKEYTFEGPFGKQTIPQEFMGFSLSPKEALAFRDFSFSGARGKKDEDFVLMEYTTIPTNAVMRGHEGEKEIVFRTVDSPLSSFELYDIKFTKEEDKRDVQLKKNKDFENLKKRFNK